MEKLKNYLTDPNTEGRSGACLCFLGFALTLASMPILISAAAGIISIVGALSTQHSKRRADRMAEENLQIQRRALEDAARLAHDRQTLEVQKADLELRASRLAICHLCRNGEPVNGSCPFKHELDKAPKDCRLRQPQQQIQ